MPDLSEGAEAGVYLALLELLDEGLIITGDELILDANSAACRLLQRDYRQVAGRPLAELFPTEEAFLAARARVLIQGEQRGVLRFALPGGDVCTLEFLAAPRLRPGIHAIILSAPGARTARGHAQHLGASNLPSLDTLADTPSDTLEVDPAHLEDGLRRALETGELLLHFQPLIDARSGRVCAGEALLRWQHPALGLLPFRRFIGAVADPTLRARVGDWVLDAACPLARQWPTATDGTTPRLAVNVGIEQLIHGDFAARVAAALRRSGLAPQRLELDLDERMMAEDDTNLAETLRRLAAIGVRLAIDDFGRGLSSIPRLRRYPVRALKLDPALVRGVGKSEDSEAVVEAISGLATTLGLEVYARGVEEPGQQAFLCALGCQLQQGPLFGRPMSAHEFEAFLAASLQ